MSVRAALAKALRRAGGNAYDRVAMLPEHMSFGAGFGAVGAAPAFGLEMTQDDPRENFAYNMLAGASAMGATGFGGIALLAGARRSGYLRDLARSAWASDGLRPLQRYARYLRRIGLDEEAAAPEFAMARAFSEEVAGRKRATRERRRYDVREAPDPYSILNSIERAQSRERSQPRMDRLAREEEEAFAKMLRDALRRQRRRTRK